MRYLTPSILFALAVLFFALLVYARYVRASWDCLSRPPSIGLPEPLTFAGKRFPLDRQDRLPMLLITVIYAITAFFRLGTLSAPQTVLDFAGGIPLTIQLSGSPVRTYGIRHYSGLGTGGYNVEISLDGNTWLTLWPKSEDEPGEDRFYWAEAEDFDPSYALPQGYNDLYKWKDSTVDNPQDVQFIRITGRADKSTLELAKFCLLGSDLQPVPFSWTRTDGSPASAEETALFAIDDTVPEKSTWYNSTYFDEIYHARTAKEHIDDVYPYEITHPPLGKLILGIGIRMFGMSPFGWRFMGTLFGVGMLPILYLFLKNLFGKTVVATCGTILFATDFMHLTQTRIATIDTYGVFFILCMYYFMYRYLTLPADASFRDGALPLFLSGLFWGLGAASKWTVIYAAVGLAVLYFMGFWQRIRDWPAEHLIERTSWIVATLAFSVLCFVLLPLFIYTLSYWPYAIARGNSGGLLAMIGEILSWPFARLPDALHGFLEGGTLYQVGSDNIVEIMLENQFYMLNYHKGVMDAHPYSSRWYQWVIDARPILYYMDNDVPGYTTRFAAFGNPLICWAGIPAMLTCMAQTFRRRVSKGIAFGLFGLFTLIMCITVEKVAPEQYLILVFSLLLLAGLSAFCVWAFPQCSEKAALILVGYLAQFLPWLLIGRTTFAYHYFPSILFLVFALSFLFDQFAEKGWKKTIYVFTGLSGVLYILFYPVLIGLTIPTWYEKVVKWIESWPF